MANSLQVGQNAPDFKATSHKGQVVSLTSYKDKKNVVLFFYPKDNTPGCTKESCTFRDQYEEFSKLDAEVIGVSGDSNESHEKFSKQYRLPFLLIADTDGSLRKLYQVKKTWGIFPGRVTFVIDKKGVIRHIFESQLNATQHVDEALKILKELK